MSGSSSNATIGRRLNRSPKQRSSMRFKIFSVWVPAWLGKPWWEWQVRRTQMAIINSVGNYAESYGLESNSLDDLVNQLFAECRRRGMENVDRLADKSTAL